MQLAEIGSRALRFFEQRGHAVVPSASLIADDPTLLLINAGMADGAWQATEQVTDPGAIAQACGWREAALRHAVPWRS